VEGWSEEGKGQRTECMMLVAEKGGGDGSEEKKVIGRIEWGGEGERRKGIVVVAENRLKLSVLIFDKMYLSILQKFGR
jgi:hypothetical protein